MRRAERLFRLVNEMRARGVSRAEDLAAHFEVSVRTIYRDIAHLQASGLPIEGEAGIGYLLRPGFDLLPFDGKARSLQNERTGNSRTQALLYCAGLDTPKRAIRIGFTPVW